MRGLFALHAEVLRRLHQADAEVLLPEAIHRHARGQRMFGTDEPLRKPEPIRRRIRRQRRQNRGHARRDFVAFLVVFAAHQHERVARLLHFLGDHRGGNRLLQGTFLATLTGPVRQRAA